MTVVYQYGAKPPIDGVSLVEDQQTSCWAGVKDGRW
jgi:hypothetical protein